MVGPFERTFDLQIRLGNAAFEENDGRPEVGRLLRAVADCVERGDADGPVFDLNGNNCGDWTIDPADDEDDS